MTVVTNDTIGPTRPNASRPGVSTVASSPSHTNPTTEPQFCVLKSREQDGRSIRNGQEQLEHPVQHVSLVLVRSNYKEWLANESLLLSDLLQ